MSTVSVLYGPPGKGKSSIALTWPKKISFYDFDLGFDRAWGGQKMVEDGDAFHHTFDLPIRSFTTRVGKLEGHIVAYQKFTDQFVRDCENPEIKTIILDTATIEWKLTCDTVLEEKQQKDRERKQLIQIEYGEPNARQRLLTQTAKVTQTDLVLVHHETEEYAPLTIGGVPQLDSSGEPKRVPTGVKLPDGFRYTLGMADWVFRITARMIEQRVNGSKEEVTLLTPVATIEKSAYDIKLVGQEIQWFTYKRLQTTIQIGALAPSS